MVIVYTCELYYDLFQVCVHVYRYGEREVKSFYFYRYLLIDGGLPNKPHPLVIKYIRGVVSQLSNVTQSLGPLEDLLSMLRPLTTPTANYARHFILQLYWTKIVILYRLVAMYGKCLSVCMYVDFWPVLLKQSSSENFSGIPAAI